MRILLWNVRGCNKPFKQKEIRVFLHTKKVDVAVLLETRVKKEKAQKIVSKIGKGWKGINNYGTTVNGKIWVIWNPSTAHVQLHEEHEQALHCSVIDVHTGKTQQLIVVYALNTNEQRKKLWEFVVRKVLQILGPLVMGGDFNAILSVDDRFQGNPIFAVEIEDYTKCIQDCELQEIQAVGAHFTWTNNQEGDHRICSNIGALQMMFD